MRWKSFGEWKAYATAVLQRLYNSAPEDNQKLRDDLNYLLTKLLYLRGRDLSNWLLNLHSVIRFHGSSVDDLRKIVPTEDEILTLIT